MFAPKNSGSLYYTDWVLLSTQPVDHALLATESVTSMVTTLLGVATQERESLAIITSETPCSKQQLVPTWLPGRRRMLFCLEVTRGQLMSLSLAGLVEETPPMM